MLIGGRAHSLTEVEYIGELGLGFAEITLDNSPQRREEIPSLLSLKNKFTFFYLAHSPKEGNPWNPVKLRERFLPLMKSLVDTAQKMAIPFITFHFWLDQRFIQKKILKDKIEIIREMADYARTRGVALCLENLSEKAEDFSLALEEIEDLGLTLDVGHGQLLSEENTSFEFIKRFPDRIKHVHLHDNLGGNSPLDDAHLPLGKGIIDFAFILRELAEASYNQTLSLEIEAKELPKEVKKLEKMLSRLKI